MKKNICVFSSSSNDLLPSYFDVAKELGQRIAQNNCKLIYGGSNVGLMGTVAKSVHEFGGKVIGVIPELIRDRGVAYELADELIITKDMRERKAQMDSLADIFIALPGGFGTLEEIIEIITLKQLGYHSKPVIFVNTNDFYKHLVQFFEHMYEERFAKSDYKRLYYITDDLDEVISYIKAYRPEGMPSKW